MKKQRLPGPVALLLLSNFLRSGGEIVAYEKGLIFRSEGRSCGVALFPKEVGS